MDNKVWISEVFENIKNTDSSIISSIQEVIDDLAKYECLINCDLFNYGFSSIKQLGSSVTEKFVSLDNMIDSHHEQIIASENKLVNSYNSLPNLGNEILETNSNSEKSNSAVKKEVTNEELKDKLLTKEEYRQNYEELYKKKTGNDINLTDELLDTMYNEYIQRNGVSF